MDNPIVVPDDIESRWRPLINNEEAVATSLAGDAWRLIKRTLGDELLDANAADPETGADYVLDVRMVIANAVIRVLKNPDGKRQESIDDYSWTRDRVLSAGILYLTDDEWRVLGGTGGKGGAFQIDTTPAGVTSGDYLPVEVTGIPEWLDWS